MVSTLITVAVIAGVRNWRWAAGRFPALIGLSINLANRGGSASAPGGRFKPRVVVAVALDEQQRVTDTLLMKGLTVFARPVKIAAMQGKHLHELQPDVIFPHDSLAQNALSLALKLKHG